MEECCSLVRSSFKILEKLFKCEDHVKILSKYRPGRKK